MELFFNELSIHGQFQDLATFRSAAEQVMNIRNIIKRFGRELYCHRKVSSMQVTRDKKMQQAVQYLSRDQQRAWMQWITRHGPFWEDDRRHDGGDYLECNGGIVTDNAVGEAAHCLFHGIECGLISINPSSWLFSPLLVLWRDNTPERIINLTNYWNAETLTKVLETDPNKSFHSWQELEKTAKNRFPELSFSPKSFEPLCGHPFVACVAYQILIRLYVLQKFKNCFDKNGKRTPQGQEIYQKHFTGKNAWFSDSSDTEKSKFKENLTFSHPNVANPLFCPWHGKVKTSQLRIHFSWPIQACKPLYIVYVGPKITKQ